MHIEVYTVLQKSNFNFYFLCLFIPAILWMDWTDYDGNFTGKKLLGVTWNKKIYY